MRNPLTIAVLSALLAACAVGPNYVRPATETPAHFARAETPDSAAMTSRVDSAFWESLDDPQLSALIEQTLSANHDLRIALSRFDAANALLRGAKFDRLPTVTAQAEVSDTRLSADQAPGMTRADRDSKSYDASVQLGWELDLFGRVRRNVEAHRADADALAADLQALQISLVAEVANDYVSLRGLQERLQVAQQNANSQADTLRLVDSGKDAGR